MKITYLTFLFLVALLPDVRSQAFLQSPMSGVEITDFTIVNYVNWAPSGISDHQCGSKTYDGHQGTDFVLPSFVAMDAGHDVLAAADGEVTFVLDTLFDRETVSDVLKGLGNYIAIRHTNGHYSYYGHLRKNSSLVTVGQQVQEGEVIAQVGSSGNSTDPHLHFELWHDSLFLVDPFAGPCGNPQSLWLTDLTYETDFRIWDSGMAEKTLTIDELRERQGLSDCCPYIMDETQTNPTSFWAQLIGLRTDDVLTIEWHTPQNQLWFSFDVVMDRDWWYYYYWSYIDPGLPTEGWWSVRLLLNGTEEDFFEFWVKYPSAVSSVAPSGCTNLPPEAIERIEVFDFMGRPIDVNAHQFQTNGNVIPLIEKVYLVDGNICVRRKLGTCP
ncbi:MAG: M23 family metallopeptidase [Saprospiraceae bacterium]|nr:M23 family metallopeptidase [Saprospiraceae bacterium]MCF8251798.1 M23 family metallopeptidase [Saprospiraceae bacterium]MCF8281452.1 M23 family metallopeptidase [Bacteroidales bacterium]MCF8313512.1 M23 family metallopeptidase [Saprospiraceae bacterium]MCF8442265.1 M23 family metallopeptidase [Saprospiraceae bacterium]